MRRIIYIAVAVAICWPLAGACDDHVMGVGFQFSATSPQGPDMLTDFAGGGFQFRQFYRITSFSKSWQMIGEFGYNNFGLRRGEYANAIAGPLADSVTALFPIEPEFPDGSVATVKQLTVTGGNFNAMHVTGGVQYVFFAKEDRLLKPYVTAQGGLYSTGQSDTDVAVSFDIQRPSMSDTTMTIPTSPLIRDDDRDNAFGLSFGGGAEYSLTEAFAVVGDFRYHVAFTEEKKTTFIDVGLGLVYFLGF